MRSLILCFIFIFSSTSPLLADDKVCSAKRIEFSSKSKKAAHIELGRLIVVGGSVCEIQNGANKLNVALHAIVESFPLIGNAFLDFTYGTGQNKGGGRAVTVMSDDDKMMKVDFRSYYLNKPKSYEEIKSADQEEYILYQNHPSAKANGLLGDLLGGIGANAMLARIDYSILGPASLLYTGDYKLLLSDENIPGGMLDVLYSYAKARRAKFNYEKENGINSCGKFMKEIKCMHDIVSHSNKLSMNSHNANREETNRSNIRGQIDLSEGLNRSIGK